LEYIDFAVENKIDFIAHSFVRNREDLLEIQKILDKKKSKIKIIAKIENQEGVDNIDDILNYCYGVMIARGDLGIELPAEKIPIVQREIIKKCIEKRKPVIVATQMLHTMITNPRPTRAEVSDVANAIYLGADAIMLSGETAYGKYPLEAVMTMTNIAKEVESNKVSFDESSAKSINKETVGFLTKSAVRASLLLPTKAIVVDTTTGRTARYLSAYRGKNVIFALCYDEKVMRELALSYGIYPSFAKTQKTTREFIRELVIPMLEKAQFKKEDLIIVVAGSFGPSHGASFLEISTVENLIK
jgi:pyruvate kinase